MGLRQFAITGMDLVAMVPPETKPDDAVCVFLGAKTPHILREVRGFASEQRYKLCWGGLCTWAYGRRGRYNFKGQSPVVLFSLTSFPLWSIC
jgi:hypothetical protein